MNYLDPKAVSSARYYTALNLLKSEIDGSDSANQKIKDSFKQVMTHAHRDKGGSDAWSSQVLAAKKCLSDSSARESYNAALEKFGISDG